MIERGYTNEEQVERIWDREEVTMLLNRHCYLAANGQRRGGAEHPLGHPAGAPRHRLPGL